MSRFRRFLSVQAALIGAIALCAPAAAFAQVPPDPGGGASSAAKHAVVVTQGSPVWTFLVTGLGAAAITAIALLTAMRLRNHARPAMA